MIGLPAARCVFAVQQNARLYVFNGYAMQNRSGLGLNDLPIVRLLSPLRTLTDAAVAIR